MKERRESARFNAAYCAETEEGEQRKIFCLEDISRGGVAFRTEGGLREEQRLGIRLFLKKRMFWVRAAVVHVRLVAENMYSVGARFIAPSKDFVDMLEKETEGISEITKARKQYSPEYTFRKASTDYQKRNTF